MQQTEKNAELSDLEKAKQILEYWTVLDFLSQQDYNDTTQEKELTVKYNDFKKKDWKLGNQRNEITFFHRLKETDNLEKILDREMKQCGAEFCGNITFYLGKVKRQECINRLQEILPEVEEGAQLVEKNWKDIAVFSFQCDKNFYIKPESVSLSPLVWTIAQLNDEKRKQSLKGTWRSLYEVDMIEMNRKYAEKCESIRFTAKEIWSELRRIKEEYLDCLYGADANAETEAEMLDACMLVTFYKEEPEERTESYTRLGQNFFAADLEKVKYYLPKQEDGTLSDMMQSLIQYICAPCNGEKERVRHDLTAGKDRKELFDTLSEILKIENAPLGKWPSKFQPAFLQQAAINLAISQKKEGLLSEQGTIFSVNGPPGTGKTTLLKEIVADSIVQRAILLSNLDNPDEAFEVKSLSKSKNYPPFLQNWYGLKKESAISDIAKYNILVASCNNVAVENITKELPLRDGIVKNFPGVDGSQEPDDKELQKVKELFSGAQGQSSPSKKAVPAYSETGIEDVYLTHYADRLFGEGQSWGLIAAPLGRKENLKTLYRECLSKIYWDLMHDSDKGEKVGIHKKRFLKTKGQFREQLQKVCAMRDELRNYLREKTELQTLRGEIENRTQKLVGTSSIQEACGTLEQKIREEQLRMEQYAEQMKGLEQEQKELQKSLRTSERLELEYRSEERKLEEKQESLQLSSPIMEKFEKTLRKGKYKSRTSALERVETELLEIEERQKSQQEQKRYMLQSMEHNREAQDVLKVQIEDGTRYRKALDQQKEDLDALYREKEQLVQRQAEFEESYSEYIASQNNGKMIDFDQEYMDALLSEEEKIAIKAQVANPWLTEAYNRERETLFYYALQLNRDFVLGSESCCTNLNMLEYYWKLKAFTNCEKKEFEWNDCEKMAADLLQTVFFIVPVISSTFASIATFFKDVKEPGLIGTLIVDEAGQAQPHMAVGAMFRARRAIIVGDPKQVEPVVTDELRLLKKYYTKEFLQFYKDKSLSVQKCADIINPFGTYYTDMLYGKEWVGCPLLVHRRCISPMYEISNKISYNESMKQQTGEPSAEKESRFLFAKSQWINVKGQEKGSNDHYVKEQGEFIFRKIEEALRKSKSPSIFIISPFKSVVYGIKTLLRERLEERYEKKEINSWIKGHVGTVHRFQGKEADEVFFVLGCDGTQRESFAVTGFVNSNIVNVAATRAKYRLYIVGDYAVWANNTFLKKAKGVMDTYALEQIAAIQEMDIPEEEKQARIRKLAVNLPSAGSFCYDDGKEENICDEALEGLLSSQLLTKQLGDELCQKFGFASEEEISNLPTPIADKLKTGILLYYLLKPQNNMHPEFDVSCGGILFCKCVELILLENFVNGLKKCFPHFTVRYSGGQIELADLDAEKYTIGSVLYILENHEEALATHMTEKGDLKYSKEWWHAFNKKLDDIRLKRNDCCHFRVFNWDDLEELIQYAFKESEIAENLLRGVFFESSVGKKLEG